MHLWVPEWKPNCMWLNCVSPPLFHSTKEVWSVQRNARYSENEETELKMCHGSCLAVKHSFLIWPQVGWDYLLNLSISLSRGNETRKDSLSNGERNGKSSSPNPLVYSTSGECGVWEVCFLTGADMLKSIGIWLRSQRGWQARRAISSLWVELSLESSCLWVQL